MLHRLLRLGTYPSARMSPRMSAPVSHDTTANRSTESG